MSISARVVPRFPARVSGADGVAVEKENGAFTVKQDWGALADQATIPPQETTFIPLWKETGSYARMSVGLLRADLLSSADTLTRAQIASHTVPFSSFVSAGDTTPGDRGTGAQWVQGTSAGLRATQDAAGTWQELAPSQRLQLGFWSAKGDGGTNDRAAVLAAVAAVGNDTPLYAAPGAYYLSADTALGAMTVLEFGAGFSGPGRAQIGRAVLDGDRDDARNPYPGHSNYLVSPAYTYHAFDQQGIAEGIRKNTKVIQRFYDGTALSTAQVTGNMLPQHFGRLIGIDDMWNFGIGGTGLLNTNSGGGGPFYTYRERLPQVLALNPDVIFVYGSTNDGGFTQAQVQAEALLFLDAIRASTNAPVFWFGPSSISATSTADAGVSAAVALRPNKNIFYQSMMSPTPAWISGSHNNASYSWSDNMSQYIAVDNTHPVDKGTMYFANRMATAYANDLLPLVA